MKRPTRRLEGSGLAAALAALDARTGPPTEADAPPTEHVPDDAGRSCRARAEPQAGRDVSDPPSMAWWLACPWCDWLLMNARGAHGHDQGLGVEAAALGARHAEHEHGRTLQEFLTAGKKIGP